MYDIELANAAKKVVLTHRNKRIISFSFKGSDYYIKRCMSNHRNRFAKQGTRVSYLTELMKIQLVNERISIAPRIVVMEETYFVMEACGQPLQRLVSTRPELAHKAFAKAGMALGKLHTCGLHHGRPALRDICYDEKSDKITLLDWENEMTFFSVDKRIVDIFLFIHGYMREDWSESTTLLDCAITAYASTSNEAWHLLKDVISFIHAHHQLFSACHILSHFGRIDVVAVDRTKEYVKHFVQNYSSQETL